MLAVEIYRKASEKLVEAFLRKQGYEDYEFTDEACQIVEISDMYLNIDDIFFDLQNNAPEGLIFEWYDKSLEDHDKTGKLRINYRSYYMGLRFEHLKND